MQIHEIVAPYRQAKHRVGRGGNWEKTSGRGQKGAGSRTGKTKSALFEGGRSSLVDRMKKLRGHKSPHAKRPTITLTMLENRFEAGETVSMETLLGFDMITKLGGRRGVKVVASGTLSKALTIHTDIAISEAAAKAVVAAGGTIAVDTDAKTETVAAE
jgi:large subunit ribosomal protein L15